MKKTIEANVMMTEHDRTVPDTLERFALASDLPIRNWGFKSIGQPDELLLKFGKAMKDAGKRLFLEVITFTDEEYIRVAALCSAMKVDVLLGTVYDPALHEKLQKCHTAYYPFVGKTPGYAGRIIKPMDEIVRDAEDAFRNGVDGMSVPAYMHDNYTGEEIAAQLRAHVPELPLMIAGRVTTFKQIDALDQLGVESFTIGGALFTNKFVTDGGYRANVNALAEHLAALKKTDSLT